MDFRIHDMRCNFNCSSVTKIWTMSDLGFLFNILFFVFVFLEYFSAVNAFLCYFISNFFFLLFLHFADSDIYFIGGFGTVAWVDVKEYEAIQPDKIAVDGGEQNLKVSYFYHCFLQIIIIIIIFKQT